MVGVVIGDEEGFAQKILAFAPAEWFVKVGRRIFDKSDEVFLVAVDGSDGLIPGMRGRCFGRLRPVVLRPPHGVVTASGRRGEVKNVALGDPEMFKQLLRMSWRSLIVRAVADSHEFFSAEFLDDIEESSPFRFAFLRARQERSSGQQGLYAMLFDVLVEVHEDEDGEPGLPDFRKNPSLEIYSEPPPFG